MKQRPIIFNTEMVRAILDGRKTQTRRAINDGQLNLFKCAASIGECHYLDDDINPKSMGYYRQFCQFGAVGDQLWVRETLTKEKWPDIHYVCGGLTAGTGDEDFDYRGEKYRGEIPSIHMPRWAARIILEVTDVRVERLNDISEQDAIKEGCNAREGCKWHTFEEAERGIPMHDHTAKDDFWAKWESIYGEQSFKSNPWVWAIEFKVISTTGGAA